MTSSAGVKSPSFSHFKRAIVSGGLAAIVLGSSVLGMSCGPKPISTTTTTTIETTNTKYPFFERRISQMRSGGKGDVADKLVSLYATEPGVAYSLSGLEMIHPEVTAVLMQQPWYTDGISDAERIFINDGLGSGEQGIGHYKSASVDDLLEKIVVNQQYKIDTVQTKDGIKNILLMYDDDSTSVAKEVNDMDMKLVKAAVPLTEEILGVSYPLQTLTFLVAPGISQEWNGTFSLGRQTTISKNIDGTDELQGAAAGNCLEELAHAWYNTNKSSGYNIDEWVSEGIAGFAKTEVSDKIYALHPDWFEVDLSAKMWYNNYKTGLQNSNAAGVPISKIRDVLKGKTDGEMHALVGVAGILFVKQFYDMVGQEAFKNTLRDMRLSQGDYVQNFGYVLTGNTFEASALKYAPDKAAVQQLFDKEVWGTAQ